MLLTERFLSDKQAESKRCLDIKINLLKSERSILDNLWTTLIEESGPIISGPFRIPRQMLAEQEYDGHPKV